MTDCPDDTNGDGNCGKWLCPYCGEGKPPVARDDEHVFFTADLGMMTPAHARRVANVLMYRASQVERSRYLDQD